MRDRRVVALLGLVIAGLAIWGLRAFTMATYRGTPPSSRTAVAFEVVTRGTASSVRANAHALLWPCVADVDSVLVDGTIAAAGEERFRAVLRPALDATETVKFRGCLRDLRVPHVRATAVEIERVS